MDMVVFCEGDTDVGAIRAVAKKLRVRVRPRRMIGNRPEKIARTCRALAQRYDKFIVLKDLHRYREETIKRIYRDTLRFADASLGKEINFLIVRHAIEAWFLADADALSRIYNCRVTEIPDPEEIENPAEELGRLLEKYGKRYIKSERISERIMNEADLQKVSKKSLSFKTFLKYLVDP